MVSQQLNKKLDELEQWFKENPKLPEKIGTYKKPVTNIVKIQIGK